ncbi:MAG: flagellar basal-body MS-ring/collar protein FliF [Gemmobacter sp.]|nr:flagellar basal-body MS-ring/collar protein FliF [Gemmobacter sp.]
MIGHQGHIASKSENPVQQVQTLWTKLDNRRRLVVAGVTLAMFLAVLGVARMASSPSMALLYAGLDSAAAGDVVRVLDQRGAAFEVRGDSIWVASPQRDQLRMSLAGEGLPATGGAGYELLDALSGFGTTSQMFDAAYLRAKEGELARTIATSPQIRSARVHIAQSSTQPFRRDQKATAAVTVSTTTGSLDQAQARALKYLVASAVSGLSPEDVAVIDAAGGLIQTGDDRTMGGRTADDRAAEMKHSIERLLAARVGPGKALVEVSLDLVTERESITERRFDPTTRVVISTETEERTNSSTGSGAGVTVASNLPDGDAASGDSSSSQAAETRERVNYEVSETSRELQRAPGGVRRQTVAVLVDGIRAPDGVWTPRPDAELADLRDLVASASGFDADRGDVITLKTMEFQVLDPRGSLSEDSILSGLDVMTLIQLAVASLVALVLGLFVLRPILSPMRRAPMPLALPSTDATGKTRTVLTGEIDDGTDLPPLSVISDREHSHDTPTDPVDRLRRLIEARQTESVEILRGWMEDREESRR